MAAIAADSNIASAFHRRLMLLRYKILDFRPLPTFIITLARRKYLIQRLTMDAKKSRLKSLR